MSVCNHGYEITSTELELIELFCQLDVSIFDLPVTRK